MEIISERPILADLETDDASHLTISLHVAGELTSRRHRRHRAIRVQLFQNPEEVLLSAADQPESEPFRNQDGALDFSIPLRQENMSVVIPYAVLPPFKYGDWICVKINLEDTSTEDVLGHESLNLLATENGILDYFSHQRMREYLKKESQQAVQAAKAAYWIDQNAENDKVRRMGLDILREYAQKGSAEAAKKLVDIYSATDQKEAAKWRTFLNHRPSKGNDKPKRIETNEKLPKKIVDEASLKTCEKLAKDGDSEAGWMLYDYSCTPEGSTYDSSKAFAYLKSAAEAGWAKAVQVLADAYEKNLIFIADKDVREYIAILKQAAGKKQADAEYLLFRIAYEGICLGQSLQSNKKEAYAWLLASAEHGKIQAAYDLWHHFEHGNEFLIDQDNALKWLIFAADHGLAQAKARLGDLYIDGKYMKKDDQKGIAYLREAAEQNNWEAQMKQFESYYEGRYKDVLFEKDRPKALDLLKHYAKSGNPQACVLIMDKYEHGNEMMMEHREALSYLRVAAEDGDAAAMYRYATVLLDGYYTCTNPEKAKQLIEEAAAHDYPEAQYALYQFYLAGYKSLKNKRTNKERAYQWLLKAARVLPAAQYEVWLLSRTDTSIDWNIVGRNAADYLFRSAAQKYGPALYQIGMAFGTGDGVEQNPERGLQLIEEAAALYHPEAVYELAQIRLRGTFGGQEVAKDEQDGLHLLLLSAELRFPAACKQVGEWYAKGLLPDESELWVQQVVQVAVDAGLKIDSHVSDQAKNEAAAAK